MNAHVALISGASRGLGAAIALELGRCGAAVAVNYFGNESKAADVVRQIQSAGGRARAFVADVRDETQIAAMIESINRQLGAVDILVINATGPQPFVALEELDWKACLEQLEFFVKSPLLLTQAVIASMKQRRWGRIIHIGSEVFERGVPKFSAYVAAKGAQLGLARSWAMELAPWNITVNLVAPGWIPTERHADVPQADKDQYATSVPLKRMGQPEEIAQTVAFLASDAAGFITGQKLSVNGGNTLH
jgi:NAD(P)-dependent dehydrogenase (short-subunit alcohol dehydrogenase family)